MDEIVSQPVAQCAPFEVRHPSVRTAPVVFASPHSGRDYPAAFVAEARLDPLTLRGSEDSFVDQIYRSVADHGAPLIRALFPRAFIDPNREPFELDPAMFEDPLPSYANTASLRVAAGLGTIARVVTNGKDIYRRRLRFAEAAERINLYYRPYHKALQGLLEDTRARFGHCLLVDCHSMPSVGGPMDPDAGRGRVEFILGDCYGTACTGAITDLIEDLLTDQGYSVGRNNPYAGGYTTAHYGRPTNGIHAIQIEINRGLYMDETRIEPHDGLPVLQDRMARVIDVLCREAPGILAR